MKEGGKGGGNTVTGLHFEKKVEFKDFLLKNSGYEIKKNDKKSKRAGSDIYYNGEFVARCFKKHEFYRFLNEQNVNWKPLVSSKLLPDDSLLVIVRETLFIIEIKFQKVTGSVDEKLQTCDFKRKKYQKLVSSLGLKVEYVYVLNDWFKAPRYKDTLDYVNSVNCHYKFDELPLAWLGLPT